MKKSMVYLLTVLMLTGLLAGCGAGQGDGTKESGEVQEESGDKSSEETGEKSSEEAGTGASAEGVNTDIAAVTEPGHVDEVLHIYCKGEDFRSRVQDFYPDYEVTGDNTGLIGDTLVEWHVFTDEEEYREILDEKLERQVAESGEQVSPDDRIDMYLVEENYLRDYVESGYSLDVMGDLKITAEELADQFPYTQQIAVDKEGKLKALTWQATPGVFAYRRSIARKVLGTDDPEKVQEAVSDWDAFAETAGLAREEGYYMLSGYGDAYQVYADNVSMPWVEDGYLNIDPHLEDWAFQTREFAENDYIHGTELYSDEWRADHNGDGEVFGFFYSSWGIHYTLQDKAEGNTGNGEDSDEDYDEEPEAPSAVGDYAVCKGPEPSHYGGQWIIAAAGTDNVDAVRSVMLRMTCDPEVMKKITSDIREFTNTVSGMKELAESDYKAEILGGQNPIPIYVEVAQELNQRYVTSYDDDLDLGFQVTMQDYFTGKTSETDALELFRKAALDRYEELSERVEEDMEEEDTEEEE